MAIILGSRALVDIAIPTGVDGAEVLRFSLKDGSNAQTIIAQAAALLGAKNQELANRYGGLFWITEDIFRRYRQGEGARTMTDIKSEFVRSDPVRSLQIGQMYPITNYMDDLAWTPEYLRDAYLAQLADDISLVMERWENRLDFDMVTRMLTNTENAIATAGFDVPWAIGTGTSVNFIPVQFRGKVFTSSHTHFNFSDSDSDGYDVLLNGMVDDLREHGFTGRLQAIVSDADIATVTALANWVDSIPADVVMPGGDTGTPRFARVDEIDGIPGTFIGLFIAQRGIVEVFLHERIPTGYAFMTKSFGVNHPSNGVAIRVHPEGNLAQAGVGFGMSVDPQVNNSLIPDLKTIDFHATHGVGVANRLNGVAGFRGSAASAYVNPTIS